ncbi:MAG TPA: DUF2946 domain-containing protein [Xanthobacteraceae bacterium]
MSDRMTIRSASMGIERGGLRSGWRRAVGVVAIYALIFQSLFFGLAAVPVAVGALDDQGLPVFELCLNGSQDGPPSPADLPGHHDDNHCVFCSLNTHHCLGSPPPSAFDRLYLDVATAWLPAEDWRLPAFHEHSNAQARGPPLGV